MSLAIEFVSLPTRRNQSVKGYKLCESLNQTYGSKAVYPDELEPGMVHSVARLTHLESHIGNEFAAF